MKKIIVICFLFVFASANAQFKASKDGFIAEDGKNFYVANVEGQDAMSLYKGVRAYILSNYRNPDIVSNNMEGEMINLHFIDDNALSISYGLGMKESFEIDLNIIMRFKDGKIRFDSPTMNRLHTQSMTDKEMDYLFSGGTGRFVGKTSLFNKEGKPKNPKIIKALEDYINRKISEIAESSKGESDEEW